MEIPFFSLSLLSPVSLWPTSLQVLHIIIMSSLLQVDITTPDGTITEIAYTVLPMETDGCPPDSQIIPSPPPPPVHSGATTTLLKRGPRSSSHLSNHTLATPPLITACDVVPRLAAQLSAASAPRNILTCHSSPPPNCDRINCTVVSTNDSLWLMFLPCSSPPALLLVVSNVDNEVLANVTVDASGLEVINITGDAFPLNFTIVQHSHYLSMGLRVSCDVIVATPPIQTTPNSVVY